MLIQLSNPLNIDDVIAMIKTKGLLGVDGIYYCSTWLTPEIAQVLLDNNPHNRDISEYKVKAMSEMMMSGTWMPNGDSIRITDAREMGDGQHRCTCVVKTGIAIPVVLSFGVSNSIETLATIDQFGSRSVHDICKISRVEEVPTREVIAVSNLMISVMDGVEIHAADRPAKARFVLSYADEMSPWVSWAKSLSRESTTVFPGKGRGTGTRAISGTALAVLAWHMEKEGADADVIQEFYQGVVNPWSMQTEVVRGLSENRRNILEALHRHTRSNPLNRVGGGNAAKILLKQYAAHINAYNRYVLDEKIVIIRTPSTEYLHLSGLPGVIPGPKREAHAPLAMNQW